MRSLASLPPPLPRQKPRERHPGVRLLAIDECPAHVDPVLGEIFRDMRLLRGMSVPSLASELGTTADVIACLEAGRVRALPPWAEVERLVSGYGRHLGFGMGPALRRLKAQIIAGDPTAEAHDLPALSAARGSLPGPAPIVTLPPPLPSSPHRWEEVKPNGRANRRPAGGRGEATDRAPGVRAEKAPGIAPAEAAARPRRSRRGLLRALSVPIVLTAGFLGYTRLDEHAAVLDSLSVQVVETIRLVASRIAEAEPRPGTPGETQD